MKYEIPKTTIFGKPIEGAMERVLAKEKSQQTQSQPVQIPSNVPDKSGFIYIPTANIYFAKQRTHLNKNWNETHELLKAEGSRMPTLPEFSNTLKYLNSSPVQEHQELYNEITEVRNPWRSEWIDAYFEQKKDGLCVLTGNKTKSEKLEDCLMQDKTPGINLNNWLDNLTKQGFPKSNINDGTLYYWHPVAGRVARFNAYSDGAYLGCYGDPSYTGSYLGVFGVIDADASGNARQNIGGMIK